MNNKTYSLILFCFLCYWDCYSQSSEYSFGEYKVLTGFCNQQSKIDIVKSDSTIFSSCSGDGFYLQIDTLRINNDKIPDFVFSYHLEDYFILGFIVSDIRAPFYMVYETDKNYMSPNLYSTLHLKNVQEINFIVEDLNADGTADIVVNLIGILLKNGW